MKKYKDLPMDLADAALVGVAEREKIRRVFMLDRRDFEVYRPARIDGRALHAQVSYADSAVLKIITLYEPDPAEWYDYRQRR
ncbi:MAG TPA: hypothetical protein VJ746_12910 [Nitrospira sp.]|nr:hypothetical protein [Nitrospira sp.]